MKSAILLSFLISNFAFSANISDKANFFEHFENLLSKKSYTELHPCIFESYFIESIDSYEVKCEDGDFGQSCFSVIMSADKYYSKKVQKCNETELHVLSENGDFDIYTEQLFSFNKGNYVKSFLGQVDELIGYEADITIDKYQPGKMTLGHGTDRARKINVINVFGTLRFKQMNHKTNFILSTSTEVPGPIQVLRFRHDGTNWVRTFDYKAGEK